MTLVVAKKKGDLLSIVSDTGISLNNEQLRFEDHVPKVCILNRSLAVGFSGSPELALAAINAAPKPVTSSYAEVTGHFLQAHLDCDQGVDFIIAFGVPLSKLALISKGKVKQNGTNEWIGDQAGFEAFQEFRQNRKMVVPFIIPMLATNRPSEANKPTFDMIGSMREVILRRDISSVFGHPVAVSNADGPFEYRSYTVTLEEKGSFQVPANVTSAEVTSQIAEAKAYAFSCLVSSVGDRSQAVAFHYLRGKLTYVYHGGPGEPLTSFTLYRGLNVIELGELAKAELGVNWIGGISSRTGVPADYGLPPSQWRTSIRR